MSQSVEEMALEARIADLRGRAERPSLPQCERCGLTLIRGVPKIPNSPEKVRSTGSYYQGCNRAGCRYTGNY